MTSRFGVAPHWPEWAAELLGTAILMFAVVSARLWLERAGTPWSTFPVRVLVLSIVAGSAVVGVAYSPLGRRSGAHLNPAVTFGLWLQHTVGTPDLVGYAVAQLVGGTTGIALGVVWGPDVAEPPVQWAAIAPSPTLSPVVAATIEAGATAMQLVVVFAMLRSRRAAIWTAAVAGVMLAVAIEALAGVTGAGFNPVRGLAPDVVLWSFPSAWIYVAGPLLGAALAACLGLITGPPLTGKLRHGASLPCHMRCFLPHRADSAERHRMGSEAPASPSTWPEPHADEMSQNVASRGGA